MSSTASHGNLLWQTLLQHLRAYQHGPDAVGKAREVIWDVTPSGTFVNGLCADACLAQARRLLLRNGRIYRWGNTLCYEITEPEHQQLLMLASRQKPEPGAANLLANLFCVGVQGEESSSQALPPAKLVNALLADEELWQRAPKICHYARRAVFDTIFNLCGPGWHPDAGILIHGPDIAPVMPAPDLRSAATAIDRLPPYIRELFSEFCFRTEADLTNALAFQLTALLINHFDAQPHPIILIDGNQPGLGKTLFV
jgi:hypothetical protein